MRLMNVERTGYCDQSKKETMCSTSTGSTTTHQRTPYSMDVLRCTCSSGPSNSNDKSQGAMLAGHSFCPILGLIHQNLFTLSRQQCYSWWGCKGSTLTLGSGLASVKPLALGPPQSNLLWALTKAKLCEHTTNEHQDQIQDL
jgi:hypothetical protein